MVYSTEQVFFKFQENHERSAIAFLFLIIYLSGISEKKYLKLSLGLIAFFICPLLTFFGLDLVWGSHYSPYTLSSSFSFLDVIYLSVTVSLFVYLYQKQKDY
jgi:hypothetical protein